MCPFSFVQWIWAACLHICAYFTEWYNLVPAEGQCGSAAREVTFGLADADRLGPVVPMPVNFNRQLYPLLTCG